MKVIVDSHIPYILAPLRALAEEVVPVPARDFTPALIKDADALIIRTRTRCHAELLLGSKVQFIGTATIGFDHIDTAFCAQHGITWRNAPGCNASSVRQYVQSALFCWSMEKGETLRGKTLGVVGVGHVGTLIAQWGEAQGMNVLRCDVPRQQNGEEGFVPLAQIAAQADIITFHTPLTKDGDCPTYHLADTAFFSSLRRKPLLINTSRGSVVDNAALLHALQSGQVADAILDVWENEPNISLPLLERAWIGTPHIAGYSADGKANATRMILKEFCTFFGLPMTFRITPPDLHPPITATHPVERALAYYDPRTDHRRLLSAPHLFEQWRAEYPLRREDCGE